MFSQIAMKLDAFCQIVMGEQQFQDTPDEFDSLFKEQETSRRDSRKAKIQQLGKEEHEKSAPIKANERRQSKSVNSNERGEVSVYRSKTGSIYATAGPKICKRDNNEIKPKKDESPIKLSVKQRVIRKTPKKPETGPATETKEKQKRGFHLIETLYYILTLQFLRDGFILLFNFVKLWIQSTIDYYIFQPLRNTRDRIKYCVEFTRNWLRQKLDLYLLNPIHFVQHSYVIPVYQHSYNFISTVHWCLTNSKKYCVTLLEVLCLRIAKLAENFRHYFAVLFLTNIVPENYSMAYHLFALFRLVLGTLYPAYASYKAVRTKNVREYVSISYTIQ